MATKMTHAARAELNDVVRKRYRAAAGPEKSKILDEFIAVTGRRNYPTIHLSCRNSGGAVYLAISGAVRPGHRGSFTRSLKN